MKPKPEKKDLNIQVGESIKAVREQIGHTQERFAELVNVSAQYISDVERGNVGISVATLKKIKEATFISSDSILMGKCDYNDVTLIIEQLLWKIPLTNFCHSTHNSLPLGNYLKITLDSTVLFAKIFCQYIQLMGSRTSLLNRASYIGSGIRNLRNHRIDVIHLTIVFFTIKLNTLNNLINFLNGLRTNTR